MRKSVAYVLCLVLVVVLSSVALAQDVKIGVVLELTGGVASYGQSEANGIKLATDEINAKGGVKGVGKIVLVTEDNKSDAAETSNAYNRVINKDKVVAIIGPATSTAALAAAPSAQQAGIPVVTPSGTNVKITQVGDYIFRECFIDPFQGYVMANFAYKDLKLRKVAMMPEVTSDYAIGLGQNFKSRFEKLGGKIVAEEKWSSGDQDFSAQLTKIKAANPDAIYVGSYYADIAVISRQARQLGIKAPLLGGDGYGSPKLFELGGSAVVGHYYTDAYAPGDTTATTVQFVKAYKAKYGKDPDAFAALGYDSAKLVFDAIARAKKGDSKAIRDALAKTKNLRGVTGTVTFDADRNPVKSAVILQVQADGSTKFIKKVEP